MMLLTSLPPETLHQILHYLDIPDLLTITRVCHLLRHLALDPHLHQRRLHSIPPLLSQYLPLRPAPHTLRPPQSSILLSRTHIVARAISRSLISIRLSRNLSSRPRPEILVDRHILPADCVGYVGRVAPRLWETREEVRKRKLRDVLRGKLERRMSVESLVNANILPGELYGLPDGNPRAGRKRKLTEYASKPISGYPKTRRPPPSKSSQESAGKALEAYEPVYPYVAVAPGLVEARRKVIKESLKDGLRAWIEKRALLIHKRAAAHAEGNYENSSFDSSDILPRYTESNRQEALQDPAERQQQTPHQTQSSHHQQPQRVSVKTLVKRFTNSIIQHQTQQSSYITHKLHRKSNQVPTSSASSSSASTFSTSQCNCAYHTSIRQTTSRGSRKRKWERPPPPYSMTYGLECEMNGGRGRAVDDYAGVGAVGNSRGCAQPTRAHVLGLRRFWEGVIRGSA